MNEMATTNLNYDTLIAYIDGLYADGSLSAEDYQKIINYIYAGGELSSTARDLIQIRRGMSADLPQLAQGELGYTLDTEELYIGGLNGNVVLNQNAPVNVVRLGVKGDGITDNTSTYAKILSKFNNLYFPEGTYVGNITLVNHGTHISGAGTQNTILKSTNTSPVINCGTFIRPKFENMQLNSTVANTESILNLNQSRYISLNNLFIIPQETTPSPTYGITFDTSIWSGYNYFDTITVRNCDYGLYSNKENNVFNITNSVFNANNIWGVYIYNATNTWINGCDISANGGETASSENSSGGLYFHGTASRIEDNYCELNARLNNGWVNNFYIHPSSINVYVDGFRDLYTRNNINSKFFIALPESLNSTKSYGFNIRRPRVGTGFDTFENLIPNGCFKYLSPTNIPRGWYVSTMTGVTITQLTSNLPVGYETGIQIATTGAITFAFNFSDVIKLDKNFGPITATFWANLVSGASTWMGFNYSTTAETGQSLQLSTPGWQKMVCEITYVFSQGRGLFLAINIPANTTIQLTGFCANFGVNVGDYEPKPITEDGGNIWNNKFKLNGASVWSDAAPPTTGTWMRGDIIFNNAVTSNTTTPIGWICSDSGTPGAWRPWGNTTT